jgi:hypothetical protein
MGRRAISFPGHWWRLVPENPRDGIETRVSRLEGAGDMLEKLMSTCQGIRRL